MCVCVCVGGRQGGEKVVREECRGGGKRGKGRDKYARANRPHVSFGLL